MCPTNQPFLVHTEMLVEVEVQLKYLKEVSGQKRGLEGI